MKNIKDQNALRKLYKIDKLSQGTISKQLCKNFTDSVLRKIIYKFLTSILHTVSETISATRHYCKR